LRDWASSHTFSLALTDEAAAQNGADVSPHIFICGFSLFVSAHGYQLSLAQIVTVVRYSGMESLVKNTDSLEECTLRWSFFRHPWCDECSWAG
jgi:hypothetical protein